MSDNTRESHHESGYKYVEDTPENRLKIEKRYIEVIYALNKVKGQLPKKVFPYVKAIIDKPL